VFGTNTTYHLDLALEDNRNWLEHPLTEEQLRELHDYVESRRTGVQDYISYHPNPIEDKKEIIRLLGLNPNKKSIGIFTNLVWDAQVLFKDTIFCGVVDWVLQTIEFFLSKPESQVILRIHPAEVKGNFETQEKILDIIRQRFPTIHEHIKIIPPESDISTYTLSEIIDVALLYTTKVGLEMALKGLPVIVAGEAFFRGKGFTYDPETRDEYFQLLSRYQKLKPLSEEQLQLAQQYVYHYFHRRLVPFRFIKNPKLSEIERIEITTLEDLLPGRDRALDIITSAIIQGKQIIYYS
jgi:hypothetical protein